MRLFSRSTPGQIKAVQLRTSHPQRRGILLVSRNSDPWLRTNTSPAIDSLSDHRRLVLHSAPTFFIGVWPLYSGYCGRCCNIDRILYQPDIHDS